MDDGHLPDFDSQCPKVGLDVLHQKRPESGGGAMLCNIVQYCTITTHRNHPKEAKRLSLTRCTLEHLKGYDITGDILKPVLELVSLFIHIQWR